MTDGTVRTIDPAEWRQYRDVRLRALQDAPDAFASTWADSRKHSDADWEARLSGLSAKTDLPLFAEHGGALAGLAWGRIEPAEPDRAYLFQMWVAPEFRGAGLGRGLVEAVVAWARSNGARELELSVTCGNVAARALYESAGFEPRGEPIPLRPGSDLLEQDMTRDLSKDTDPSSEETPCA